MGGVRSRGGLVGSDPWLLQGQIKKGRVEKKAQGRGQPSEERAPNHWKGRRSKGLAGCGVVVRVDEGLDPGGDVQGSSSPLPSLPLHTSPLPFSLFSTPLLSSSSLLFSPALHISPVRFPLPELWPVPSGAEYPSGFRGCLPGVSQLRRRGEEGGGGLRCHLVHEGAGGSTMDSAGPGLEAPARRGSCAPAVWAPDPAAGGSRSPPSRLLFPGGLPGPSTSVPEPQPASRRLAESPGPGLRVWRPW